jgi:diguanylate cyclase (GGDEF)-like protein/PAS domain S-box-containing protein
MASSHHLSTSTHRRHKYLLFIAIWSGLIFISLSFNYDSLSKHTVESARAAAVATINKDMSFRKWAASHGGVYVPPSARTPSNPYLFHPQKDIETRDGMKLTLMNPAYMLRDMQRHFSDDYGIKTNITSLNPLNPYNQADEWEKKALKQFEQTPTLVEEISLIENERYMRLMLPFVVETECLKCHAHQGYKIGEIRGGIGTAVPMKSYYAHQFQRQLELGLSHGVVWFIGLVGFGLSWRRERQIDNEREQNARALRESELLYRSVTNNGQALIWLADLDKKFIFFNQPWLEFTGRSLEQEYGDGWAKGVHADDLEHCLHVFQSAYETQSKFQMVYRLMRHDDVYRWILDEGAPRYNTEGEFVGFIGHCLDISELKEAQSQIDYLAHYDSLTSLPNRHLIMRRLQQKLHNEPSTRHYSAILLIDLDNFKLLNDTLGHQTGDQLLIQVAKRLEDLTHEHIQLARLGGDEFMLYIEQLDNQTRLAAEQAETLARHVLNSLREPFHLGLQDYRTTSSIGIMLFSGTQYSAEELLRFAEVAMYQAKETGRNTLRFFDPQMQALVSARNELEHDLRKAVTEQQFLLYLQPQVNVVGQIIGAEALIRWQHPQRGLISPVEFIALAEETGLIIPMGTWVLEQACQTLVRWANDPLLRQLTLAVNVSARQFYQSDFVEQTLQILQQTGANPMRLKLELTETLFVIGIEQVITKMRELKDKGVRFSLDDFGTGYSSLGYLKRLPLDQLKIDQSFVRDILEDSNDAAIAKMVLALSETLELRVIAEGVETQAQYQLLREMGCEYFQGYYFGHPMPITRFETFNSENGSKTTMTHPSAKNDSANQSR